MYLQFTTEPACCCALNFKDGNTDEFASQVVTDAIIFDDNNFAVECWINPSAFAGDFSPIVNHSTNGSIGIQNYWSLDVVNDAGTYRIRFTAGDILGSSRISQTSGEIQLGQWYHIVANRITTSPENFEIYINGVLQSVQTTNNSNYNYNISATGNALGFLIYYGRYSQNSELAYYAGSIAQVRIYNRQLGQAEVRNNYSYGFYSPVPILDVVMWTPLNNCEGIETLSITSLSSVYDSTQIGRVALSNFGTRTDLGEGAWISDCGHCNSSCYDADEYEDVLYMEYTDQQKYDYPLNPDMHLFIGTMCTTCEQDSLTEFALGTDTQKYIKFAIRIPETSILPGAVFQLDLICDAMVMLTIGPIEVASYANAQEFIEAILDAFTTNATGFSGDAYFEGDIINFRLVPALVQPELWDCLCNSSLVTRRVLDVDDIDELLPYNNRPVPSVCISDKPINNFAIISVFNMCIDQIDGISCVIDKQLVIEPAAFDFSTNPGCKDVKRICLGPRNLNQYANFFSQRIDFSAKQCDTIYIRYRNENQEFRVLRIRANVTQKQYEKEQEISVSSKGVNRKLLSIITPTYELRTDWYTSRWHDKMINALESDYVEIEYLGEWVRVMAKDTYKIDYDKNPIPTRGTGSIKLQDYNYYYANNFC